MPDKASDNQSIYDSPLGSARVINRVLDAANDYDLRRRLAKGGTDEPFTIPTDIIKVRNDSCGDRRKGEVLEVCDHLLEAVDPAHLWFSAAAPSGQKCYGILRKPLLKEAIAEAQVSGVVAALVNITSTAHQRATVASGKVVLQSSSTGPIQILWKPDGAGEKECVVLVENPCSTAAAPTTTTTTPAPACTGKCKWTWSISAQAWSLTNDACSTTTTTTTSGPTTTTTTNPCPCPKPSTTTTTTTPAPCECLYPRFCGLEDGDCTYTYCTTEDGEPEVSCTTTTTTSSTTTSSTTSTTTTTGEPTTTTTCDCNTTTTTTTTPCPCCRGCDWACLPTAGGIFVWQLTFNGCSSICPCSAPTTPCAACTTAHTNCPPPPPPPPPTTTRACTGGCTWWWIINRWVLTVDNCAKNIGKPCVCSPPTSPGSPGSCGPTGTGCVTPTTTTTTTTTSTTTPVPCAGCYPTTTTTCNPCGNNSACKYECAAGVGWSGPTTVIACPDGCSCPEIENADLGECGPDNYGTSYFRACCGTTSTTSTTTTIAPCAKNCLWRWSTSGSSWSLVTNPCPSSCPCGSPPFTGTENCELVQTPCSTETTTTSTTTTTTTLPPTTTTTTSGPTTTTTTTFGPTTTTSSTTTTCEPLVCDGQGGGSSACFVRCSGGVWVVEPQPPSHTLCDECPSECACCGFDEVPTWVCTGDPCTTEDEVVTWACRGPTTTTTTTSPPTSTTTTTQPPTTTTTTTTTSPPTSTTTTTSPPTSTTTTTTTTNGPTSTTTPSPCNPCFPCADVPPLNCVWRCEGGSWALRCSGCLDCPTPELPCTECDCVATDCP